MCKIATDFVWKILMVVLSVFLPPLAVYLTSGCGLTLLINILLTLLGFLPGVVHALIIVILFGP